jgi:hypothetical protein
LNRKRVVAQPLLWFTFTPAVSRGTFNEKGLPVAETAVRFLAPAAHRAIPSRLVRF